MQMSKQPSWEIEREVKVLAEVGTDSKYGKRPSERTISEHIKLGIVNLDKPPNPSSHQVVAWVKNILGVSHAGHGGTLEAKGAGETPWSQEYSQ
jgi:tRNA U55 pseudouridine synthase TruB